MEILKRGLPNPFGRTSPLDYTHLAKIHDDEGVEALEAYIAERVALTGKQFRFDEVRKYDRTNEEAASLQFVTDNQTHLVIEAEYWLYRKAQFMDIIPMKTDVEFGATAVQYQVYDLAAKGDFVDEPGSSINYASVTKNSPSYGVRYGATGVKYNLHELAAAAFGGTNLNPLLMKAAMMGANKHIEQAWFRGLNRRGADWSRGILNQSTGANGISRTSVSTQWDASTPETALNILETIQTSIDRVQDDEGVVGTNLDGTVLVLLPPSQFKIVCRRPLSETIPNKSIWEYVEEKNTWSKRTNGSVMVKELVECRGAGQGGTDRMMTGLFSEETVEGCITRPPTPRAPQLHDLEVKIAFDYAFAPIYFKRLFPFNYTDGI